MTTRHQLFLVVLAGLVAVATTAWSMYPNRPRTLPIHRSQALFVHCPECGQEWGYSESRLDSPCARCGVDLVATKESVKEQPSVAKLRIRMWMTIFAEMIVVMGLILFVTKRRGGTAEEASYLHMRCPRCEQKLRFRENQIGHVGKCPRCKRVLRFPAESVAEEADTH